MVDWYGTPHTEALHVVERYRLLDYEAAKEGFERDAKENFVAQGVRNPNYGGKYLQLQFMVEDKGVFTTPWTATMTYGRTSSTGRKPFARKTPTGSRDRKRRSPLPTKRTSEGGKHVEAESQPPRATGPPPPPAEA